jgi:oxygen-independent coproporphyrinogen-3 oxidase
MAEYTFLALRTAAGVSYADFAVRFGVKFTDLYGEVVGKMSQQGLVAAGEDGIRLTTRGQKYGNVVFAAFLPDGA